MLISLEVNKGMEAPVISGMALTRDEAKITVSGVPDTPGVAYKGLSAVGDAGIDVDVIVQNASVGNSTDITFTVKRLDLDRTCVIVQSIADSIGASGISTDKKIAKVSLVGVGMRSHAGVASLMFKTLAEEGINIQIITTSEIKTSVVIDEKYLELAVRTLHAAFGLGDEKSSTSA